MSKAQVYVVRIYGAAPEALQLRGIVEDVEQGSRASFTRASELWDILIQWYEARSEPRARDDEA